jgi:hypothetical protein
MSAQAKTNHSRKYRIYLFPHLPTEEAECTDRAIANPNTRKCYGLQMERITAKGRAQKCACDVVARFDLLKMRGAGDADW